tara:strand:+ start:777 stop:1550 length:774 start_codon:yes stop_codon:yes gene_type:complete
MKNVGKFYKCDPCEVMVQEKKFKNLYDNQDSSNYNLRKNFFYYLKQVILSNFIFNLRKFFYKKKFILDYGCGSGELAIALSLFYKKKNIYTADVFNLDKKFIPKIKKHYLLHRGQLRNKKFDIIVMRHVFEHIFDLNKFIKKIKKNLKNKDSNLIIEVPNMNSMWRKIMKERWPGYFYPFHYYVFSKKFLKTYLSKNDLKVVGEQNLEPAIIGSYLLTFGINKSICKLLSLIFYPLQFLISKIFVSSEAILIIVKKK